MPGLRVGEAGLEPGDPLLIRQVPSPFGHSPGGSESQVRTDGLRLMRAPLWPAELSRRGQSWSRTRRLPLYQSGPFTGWVIALGTEPTRKMECRAQRPLDRHELSRPGAAPAAHLPCAENHPVYLVIRR